MSLRIGVLAQEASISAILARPEIQAARDRDKDQLVITPLLAPSKQLGQASVDVRLGNEFILFRRRAIEAVDISRRDHLKASIAAYQEKGADRLQTAVYVTTQASSFSALLLNISNYQVK